jgi:hypothetical protein
MVKYNKKRGLSMTKLLTVVIHFPLLSRKSKNVPPFGYRKRYRESAGIKSLSILFGSLRSTSPKIYLASSLISSKAMISSKDGHNLSISAKVYKIKSIQFH